MHEDDHFDLGRLCQSICVAASSEENDQPHLIRTFEDSVYTRFNQNPVELRIWEVGRATSAAPDYFHQLEKLN